MSQNPRYAPDVYLNSNKWSEHFGLFTSNPARLYLWCLGAFAQWILSDRSQNKPTRLKLSAVDATYLDFFEYLHLLILGVPV